MTTIVVWAAADGTEYVTRVFTAHVRPFTDDVHGRGGSVTEVRAEG